MKLDARVKFKDGRPYVERFRKNGKQVGQIMRDYGEIITCLNCGEKCFATDWNIIKGRGKFCSLKCINHLENNGHWQGGRKKRSDGYIYVKNPTHPYRTQDEYIMEHRLIVEKVMGRYLEHEETVHHINHIKDDNRRENLMVFSNSAFHLDFEMWGKKIPPQAIIFDGRLLKPV